MASYDEVMTALRNADAAGNAEDARQLAQIASRLQQTNKAPVEQIPGIKEAAQPKPYSFNPLSVVDAAATGISGALGGIVAPVAGVAGSIASGKLGTQEGVRAGEDVARRVSEGVTWRPRTEGGKEIVEEVGKLASRFAGMNPTQSLAAAAMAPAVAAQAQTALGARQAAKGAELAKAKALNSVKDDTLAAARAEGYKVPRSADNPTFLSNRLESIGGKDAMRQQAAIENQSVTNKIARREAGLAEDQPITEGTLKEARDRLAQPYREVDAISPRAKVAHEKLQEARAESKVYWNHHNVSKDPISLRKAESFDAKAEMLEKVIASEAGKSGKPELAAALKEARTALAKNYTVERALNLGSGDVDAMVIGRMLDKGNKLTGGLETIGKFANAFSPYAREGGKVPTPGVSKSEALAAVLLGTGGVASGLGALPAALPLLSHPARALALSRQKPRTYEQSALLTHFPRAADEAGVAFGATPLLGWDGNELRERR